MTTHLHLPCLWREWKYERDRRLAVHNLQGVIANSEAGQRVDWPVQAAGAFGWWNPPASARGIFFKSSALERIEIWSAATTRNEDA